jgi:hypothetical protein
MVLLFVMVRFFVIHECTPGGQLLGPGPEPEQDDHEGHAKDSGHVLGASAGNANGSRHPKGGGGGQAVDDVRSFVRLGIFLVAFAAHTTLFWARRGGEKSVSK